MKLAFLRGGLASLIAGSLAASACADDIQPPDAVVINMSCYYALIETCFQGHFGAPCYDSNHVWQRKVDAEKKDGVFPYIYKEGSTPMELVDLVDKAFKACMSHEKVYTKDQVDKILSDYDYRLAQAIKTLEESGAIPPVKGSQ